MGILDRDELGQIIFASLIKIAAIRVRRQEKKTQKTAAEKKKEREKKVKTTEKTRKT